MLSAKIKDDSALELIAIHPLERLIELVHGLSLEMSLHDTSGYISSYSHHSCQRFIPRSHIECLDRVLPVTHCTADDPQLLA